MRVKDYLSVVVIVCVGAALALEFAISQQSGREKADTLHQAKLARFAAEFGYIDNNLTQFLLSADLVIGSGESYLVAGTLAQHPLLEEQLRNFRDHSPFTAIDDSLHTLQTSLGGIAGLVEAAGRVDGEEREIVLNRLVTALDPAYITATETAASIRQGIDASLVSETDRLASGVALRRITRVAALFGFFAIVLMVWRWATRKLVAPLAHLAEMANESTAKDRFVGIDCGPKEVMDMSDRLRRLTSHLAHQATHDPLTNLINRRELERLLEKWRSGKPEAKIANTIGVICYIDLDRFKLVNDSCGHSAGDDLLIQVSDVFRDCVDETGIVARLGGDEFCIVLKGHSLDEGIGIANDVRQRIEALRFEFRDQVFRISSSIGVSAIASDVTDSESIIDQADSACAVAKESGRNRIYVFDLSDSRVDQRRVDTSWVSELMAGLDQQRLVLYQQPIVKIFGKPDHLKRFEILVRMTSADGTLIPPSHFMPVAERYNMGVLIDRRVVTLTLDWLAGSPRVLETLGRCSINLCGDTLSQPKFGEFLLSEIARTGVPAERLCFEITETQAISDMQVAMRFISQLKASGCQFALDDFGTGHASFSYLRELPVDYVKIDGSFVRNILENRVDDATVRSFIDVAHACGKLCVAEFVESREIYERLVTLGVDYAQGYYFGQPEPVGIEDAAEVSNVIQIAG